MNFRTLSSLCVIPFCFYTLQAQEQPQDLFQYGENAGADTTMLESYSMQDQGLFQYGANVGIGIKTPQSLLHINTKGTVGYPSKISRGNILQLLEADNNGLEIGVTNELNTRKAWLLARHSLLPEYGIYYSTLHLQPQIDVNDYYRGVAMGYLPSVDIPYGVGLVVAGNVGIGTTTPLAKLSVNGNILATEIKVKTDIEVPDYVFDPTYQLPILSSIENYVKTHRHLPEVPSASEIQKDGIDLAQMSLVLLKKVEELTLHLIEKEKEIEKLKINQEAGFLELSKRVDKIEK